MLFYLCCCNVQMSLFNIHLVMSYLNDTTSFIDTTTTTALSQISASLHEGCCPCAWMPIMWDMEESAGILVTFCDSFSLFVTTQLVLRFHCLQLLKTCTENQNCIKKSFSILPPTQIYKSNIMTAITKKTLPQETAVSRISGWRLAQEYNYNLKSALDSRNAGLYSFSASASWKSKISTEYIYTPTKQSLGDI